MKYALPSSDEKMQFWPLYCQILKNPMFWLLGIGLNGGAAFIGAQFGPGVAMIGIRILACMLWSLFLLLAVVIVLVEAVGLVKSTPSSLPNNLSNLFAEGLVLRLCHQCFYMRLKNAKNEIRRLNAFWSLMVIEDFRPSSTRGQKAFILALNDPSQALQKAALESMHRLPDEQALALIHNRMRNEPDPTSRAQLDWFANIHQQRIQEARLLSERTPLNEYGELMA